MRYRSILSVLALATAAFSAGQTWHLDSTYSFDLNVDTGNALLRDLEFKMDGGYVDTPESGWGVSTSFYNNGNGARNSDTVTVSMDTGPDSTEPYLTRSLFFGVIQGLPQDITDGNPDQKHLVLFVNNDAAAAMKDIAYGTIFGTDNQTYHITEESLIDAIETVHRDDLTDEQKLDYYQTIYDFRDTVAHQANVGPNGTPGDIWFGPNQSFSIVMFSDGTTIGSGTSSYRAAPVPEPASFAALGLGAVALLRRRRAH